MLTCCTRSVVVDLATNCSGWKLVESTKIYKIFKELGVFTWKGSKQDFVKKTQFFKMLEECIRSDVFQQTGIFYFQILTNLLNLYVHFGKAQSKELVTWNFS